MRRIAREPRVLLAAILFVSASATVGAMRRTSTTFDEIVMIAGGARGFELGRFDLAPEHPPLTQFIYGLPVYLSRPNYPPELGGPPPKDMGYRYAYAREFFARSGNDPEKLAFLGRLGAAALGLTLVLLTFAYTRSVAGPGAGLVAALLVAFLPDVLAHGGVAYNDIPVAVGYLAGLWALDRAARNPTPWRALVAGAAMALAIGVKFSAVVLYPAGAMILAAEAATRWGDRAWLRRLLPAGGVVLIAHYLTLVLIYQGDYTLAQFRYGLDFTFLHVSKGHGAPAYLLGETSQTGWWYFFPIAFLLKTPAALHVLGVTAVVGLLRAVRERRSVDFLASPLRAPVLGAVAFGGALLGSSLHIGFRYGLPLLPLLCMLTAVGVVRLWPDLSRAARAAVALLLVWYAGSSLSYYPHFLAYTSEYGGGRDRGYELLADSSLDWGQGLLELRDYMRTHGISRVYLSYFGSALPEGYGIDYVPMASFFPLSPSKGAATDAERPAHMVVSATNLAGVYLPGDPFAYLRNVRPDTVLAHTLFVYHLDD